jgi:hypothetical protein
VILFASVDRDRPASFEFRAPSNGKVVLRVLVDHPEEWWVTSLRVGFDSVLADPSSVPLLSLGLHMPPFVACAGQCLVLTLEWRPEGGGLAGSEAAVAVSFVHTPRGR